MRAKMTCLSGVMITASHNQKDDNGVKIIEGDGAMLDQNWEPLAELLVNAPDLRQCLEALDEHNERSKYGFMETIFHDSSMAQACFGMDTRETSPMLMAACIKGCELMGVQSYNLDLTTTPQLHWLVSNQLTHINDVGLYSQHFKDAYLRFLCLC